MNQEHKELLQKIVAEVKELTGIEVDPNYEWMRNLTGDLIGLLPDEYEIYLRGIRKTAANCSTLIKKYLDKHPLLYSALLEEFLDKILFIKKLCLKATNGLSNETKSLVNYFADYKVAIIDKILAQIESMATIFMSVLADADNEQSTQTGEKQ